MPWCPNCKNEYKDGYTLCADCGAELVDELTEESVEELSDISELLETPEISVSEDILMELVDNIEDTDEEALANFIVEEKNKRPEKVKTFVKASARAENYRSSAYALLIVGVLGLAFLVCSYFKIINVALAPNIDSLFYIVMGIMFIAFIIIGLKTFSAAKVIDAGAQDEDELTNRIYAYFADETAESVDRIAFEDDAALLTGEEKFFPRSVVIKNIIIDNFGELDEAFMTELVETVYSNIYEK